MVSQDDADTSSHTTGRMSKSRFRNSFLPGDVRNEERDRGGVEEGLSRVD
jgi:hypothetical protein